MKCGCVKTEGDQAVSSRCRIVVLVVLFFSGAGGNALALTNAILPNLQGIVGRAVNYAITNEDPNTALFNHDYKYTRSRTWVTHNVAGKMTNFKQTQTEENTSQPASGAVNLKYLEKGRDLRLKSYPITNIVARFDFSLTGEESVNGRKAYVIDFVPRKHLPVSSEFDLLVNATTGTVWVDAEDSAIAKVQFHLNASIKVAHGLVGQIDTFTCKVARLRSPEGYWFVRKMDWHLEGRLITVRRIIDYHEDRTHQLPISTKP